MARSSIILETERLILRPFELTDAEIMFHNWANDSDVVRFMPYDLCTTIEETCNMIEGWLSYLESVQGWWGLFAIKLKTTGEIIGTIDFAETDREARSAEVGYQLGKSWWGAGYATEALQALLAYCLKTLGLNRVWAVYDPQNINSGKVMQKAGMLYEGTLRQYKVYRGELVSRIQYAMLAEDYS